MLKDNLSLSKSDYSKYFHKLDGCYILKNFKEIGHLPEYITIDGIRCRRFLDIFWLPGPLSKLTQNQTKLICDIRLYSLEKIISLEYNKYIIYELLRRALQPLLSENILVGNILDYGIGSGISLECLQSFKIGDKFKLTGTDISLDAIRVSQKLGIDTFCWNNGKQIPLESFDAIISSFVFDFHITYQEIKRLYNYLKPGRHLVLNLYKKEDKNNYRNIYANLMKAGFKIQKEVFSSPRDKFCINHREETIIVAEKYK